MGLRNRQQGQRWSESQSQKKEGERIKETTTEAQSPLSPVLPILVGCGARDLAQLPTMQPLSERFIYTTSQAQSCM